MVPSSWAPVADFVAGILSGIAGLIVGYPFDTVKVRLQNPILARRYASSFHAFVSIVREEGFMGLFKGITSPLATAALLNGFFFASYYFFLKIELGNIHAIPTLIQVFIAGAWTGVAWSVITTPTELIKIRQQDQLVPTSTRSIILEIIREDGILGLYRGLVATILRDTSYGAYFAAYEGTIRLISQTNVPWYGPLLAGGVAGIAVWVITFPFDVVKTRMQGARQGYTTLKPHEFEPSTMTGSMYTTLLNHDTITDIKANPYESVVSTIVHSYKEEGFGVFFQGLGVTVIRAIPVNMAIFTTFEAISRVINSIH